ncbi:MAG TPA: HAD family hydrolase [Solirubrobacterales bacterium]|nr:HAD family hydrolase [Solirubrobacterales bacterium]
MSTIAFDLGGVLLTDGSKTAWKRLDRELGIPADLSARLWETTLQQRADLGDIPEEAIWAELQRLEPGVSTQDIRGAFLEGYVEIPHGIEALLEAKAAGWEVALATNNVAAWLGYWRSRHAWMESIDVVCCSSDLGFRKPAPEFFEALLCQVADPHAYFVDDDDANCAAAAQTGFRAILADPEGAWPVPDFAAEARG